MIRPRSDDFGLPASTAISSFRSGAERCRERPWSGTQGGRELRSRHRPGAGRLTFAILLGYDVGMKIAISLPDELFESADELAERMGVSRSELYARAMAEYLAKHRDEDVTAKLNEVFGEEPSGLDPSIRKAQTRSVSSSDW